MTRNMARYYTADNSSISFKFFFATQRGEGKRRAFAKKKKRNKKTASRGTTLWLPRRDKLQKSNSVHNITWYTYKVSNFSSRVVVIRGGMKSNSCARHTLYEDDYKVALYQTRKRESISSLVFLCNGKSWKIRCVLSRYRVRKHIGEPTRSNCGAIRLKSETVEQRRICRAYKIITIYRNTHKKIV